MHGHIPQACLEGIYEFVRCRRANGSFYGTAGKCRKGKEDGAEIETPSTPTPKTGSEADRKPKTKAALAKEAKLAKTLDSLFKERQQLLDRGEMRDVLATSEGILQILDKVEKTPETKKIRDKLHGEQKDIIEKIRLKNKEQEIRDNRQKEVNLSYEERDMIRRYTAKDDDDYYHDSSFKYINGCLRKPNQCEDRSKAEPYIKQLDEVLGKLPKNPDGHEFYRGVTINSPARSKQFEQLMTTMPGTVIKDSGFGSYSSEKREALRFTSPSEKNILFVSRNKSLTPVNVFSEIPSEREALLPRGLEQTIRKVTLKNNTLIVELE